jgi:site-specific DNA-methyltransferase (adenine-specific)
VSDYRLFCGDCLDVLPGLEAGSIDAIIADPPYGTTACAWDSVIPLEPMWAELKRVIKPRGAIVLFGSKPFSAALVMSHARGYKHEWIWKKHLAGNFAVVKYMPLSMTESIMVFTKNGERANYYPQMRKDKQHTRGGGTNSSGKLGRGFGGLTVLKYESDEYYPQNVLDFREVNRTESLHESQKPVDLLRYLIRTYTNPGETVLDFCFGSGTTGVACRMEGRRFIGVELDPTYYAIAERRIANAQPPLLLDAPAVPAPEQAAMFAD